MYIDKYRNEKGEYILDGINFGVEPGRFIQRGLLELYNCKSVEQSLKYISRILNEVKNCNKENQSERDFQKDDSLFFAYCVLKEKGLIIDNESFDELTNFGKEVLADINTIFKN